MAKSTGIRLEHCFLEKWQSGNFLYVRCPLCHNPSMWVDAAQDLCGCFEGCTVKPLDVINLYALLSDVHNEEAILSMAKML